MVDPPPPPPRPVHEDRRQLNTKIRVPLHGRFARFVELYGTTKQAVVEGALEEYMDRRGYTEAVDRAARRPGGRGRS